MKFTRKFVAVFFLIVVCVVVSGLLVLPTEVAQAQSISAPSPALSSHIPANPPLILPSEKAFGEFAWETFVALNWPADCKGKPLNLSIDQESDQPRVWEFYHFPEDIFLSDGEAPQLSDVVPPQCSASTKPDPVSIFIPGNQPGKRDTVLIDRAGNYILNEIRINPVEVTQITQNSWYSADNLTQFNNTDNPFQLICSRQEPDGRYPKAPSLKIPCSSNAPNAPNEGAIELKASWMVLDPSKVETFKSQYYTTKRTFSVPGIDTKDKQVTVDVGLVGFHMALKTSQSGWVWATFEHIDNAPDQDQPDDTKNYNLYSSDCEREHPHQCDSNQSYAEKPYLWGDKFPYAVTQGSKKQTPSQILRAVLIDQTISDLNQTWQSRLDGVWKNYQLIGVQWLKAPYSPYSTNRGVTPSQLANVTIEPYVKKNGQSCITCHTSAKLPNKTYADFSFLMMRAKHSSNQAPK